MMAMQNWQKLVVEIFSQSWAIAPTLQQGVDNTEICSKNFGKIAFRNLLLSDAATKGVH